MKNGVGLLELLIVVIIAIAIYIFIPANIKTDILPTKQDVQEYNSQKTEAYKQLEEIQKIKTEHDKQLENLE